MNVDHRLWYVQSPLRQFPEIAPETSKDLSPMVLKRFEKKDIQWERYFDLQSHDLGQLVGNPKLGDKIYGLLKMVCI